MTRPTERRVELMLGRRVVDPEGEVVGRLEEVIAELEDDGYVVREFHVGAYAMFERLGSGMLGRGLLKLIGGSRLHEGYVVPWALMDLSDADQLRVTVPKRELRELGEAQYAPVPARSAGRAKKRRSA